MDVHSTGGKGVSVGTIGRGLGSGKEHKSLEKKTHRTRKGRGPAPVGVYGKKRG